MFEVALALGEKDPRKMLREMDKDTFIYWVAFLNRKKKSNTKENYQLALLTKVVAEIMGGKRRDLKSYMIEFKSEEERSAERDEENFNMFLKIAQLTGGKVTTLK